MQREQTKETPALFSASRLRLYASLTLSICMIRAFWMVYAAKDLIDIRGKPIGYDFITFWSAGHLALEGRPEAAFIREAIIEAQQLAVPGNEAVFLWHYPPTFMLLAAVLATVPYLTSYILFAGSSFALYFGAVRRFLDQPAAWLLILAYPGTFLSVMHGQNSMLTTGLLALALFYLKPKPVLAGVFIGLLAFKPQLALLIPLVLIAGRQWQTFASATITTVLFVGLSLAAFGPDLWVAFFENITTVRGVMGDGFLRWEKMPSLYITLRMFGVPDGMAFVAHWIAAGCVTTILLWLWYRIGTSKLSCAALVSASLLILPYIFDYEMTLLAIPIAILAVDIAAKGGQTWEKVVLVIAFVAPLILAGIAQNFNIQIGFPVILSLFVVAVRRGVAEFRVSSS